MTYYRRKIQRLWNGYASLKDYEVKKAIAKGGAVLSLNKTNEKMTLSKRGSNLDRLIQQAYGWKTAHPKQFFLR